MRTQILNDPRKTARENYIDIMRQEFLQGGVDAYIADQDGELIVVSDLFKSKPNRDQILRNNFGLKVRRNLCTMGFTALALKSGVLFGDGDEYSLGCPETKEEKEERLRERRTKRQEFIQDVQRSLSSGQPSSDIQVSERSNEIVLTAASAKDLTPQMIRAMLAVQLTEQAKENFCSVGFLGIRVRSNVNSSGTLISFGCPAKTTQ